MIRLACIGRGHLHLLIRVLWIGRRSILSLPIHVSVRFTLSPHIEPGETGTLTFRADSSSLRSPDRVFSFENVFIRCWSST